MPSAPTQGGRELSVGCTKGISSVMWRDNNRDATFGWGVLGFGQPWKPDPGLAQGSTVEWIKGEGVSALSYGWKKQSLHIMSDPESSI